MSDVVIAGIGQTPVGEHWGISLRDLAVEAINAARSDCGGLRPQAMFVGNMLAPTVSAQAHVATLVADHAGMVGIEASTVEAGGASGGAALRQAFLAVTAGGVDCAIVVGVEKFSDQIGGSADQAITSSVDGDFEAVQGLTPTAQAALLMRRYLHEYGVPQSDFSAFPIIAHNNGEGNPNAMYRASIDEETYQRAGVVSEPLNLFDIAPTGDGAAAVILTHPEYLPPQFPHPLVRISGSSMVSDTLAIHDRREPIYFQAVHASIERACRQAGILPTDVDLFELYDAYSIYAALTLEAAGFAPPGKGCQLAQFGQFNLHGPLPISTMGGLKARGNAGGATGVYQVVEATLQLRGQAGKNQINAARRALIQCLGGPAALAVTHILESVK